MPCCGIVAPAISTGAGREFLLKRPCVDVIAWRLGALLLQVVRELVSRQGVSADVLCAAPYGSLHSLGRLHPDSCQIALLRRWFGFLPEH